MIAIGLDLSLTRTGVAGAGWTSSIRVKTRGHERLQAIREAIADYTRHADLVVIEGLAYDGHDRNRQNAGLSWHIRHDLWLRGTPYALVPPSCLKVYAAGNGGAHKEAVRAGLAERLTWITAKTPLDESDAATLAVMGYDHLGQPLAEFPEANRSALKGGAWPDMAERLAAS